MDNILKKTFLRSVSWDWSPEGDKQVLDRIAQSPEEILHKKKQAAGQWVSHLQEKTM